MYPILSLLRRCCAKVLYVSGQESFCEIVNGSLRVKTASQAQSADFATLQWGSPKGYIPLYMCVADAPSAIDVARYLTHRENLLGEGLNAVDCLYTLLLGEEEQAATAEGVQRTVRIGAVRGVFRPPEFSERALVAVPASSVQRAKFRDLPPGVVPQKR